MMTFIIQYNNSVASVSLANSKESFHWLNEQNVMVKRHLIRGYADQIFFAETIGGSDRIMKLELHENSDKVKKKEVYRLTNS